jgi:hypothetical protein
MLIRNAHRKGRDLMRRRTFCILVGLAVLLVTTSMIDNASATTNRHVGLRVGDTAEYALTGWYADRMSISVTNVEGSHITLNCTYYYNGTVVISYESSYDVDSLSSNSMLRFLIAANLEAGDPILTYSNVTLPIEETIQKQVAGYDRSVNYAEDIPLGILPTGGFFVTDQPYATSMYWDQATGLLVEANIVTMMGYETLVLVSTNAFHPTSPDYAMASLLIVSGLAIVTSIVTIAVVANRRRAA